MSRPTAHNTMSESFLFVSLLLGEINKFNMSRNRYANTFAMEGERIKTEQRIQEEHGGKRGKKSEAKHKTCRMYWANS